MLSKKNIFIQLLETSHTEDLLNLELNNKSFFQLYTPLRKEKFYTLEGQLERIKTSILFAKEDAGYSFGIFLIESRELIGNISLSEVVRSDLQSCWLGYYLDKHQNGKGYMTEAVNLAVDYAFKELNLHRIEAGVMPDNKGSIKVLEKAGFHKEGIAKENVRINGKWEDHQILAIINNK
ncbi:GNAT family N-acetyltransferase [Chengkuizengella marina]|uniref:N-acetyltransferase n=1 Tax=Chengkuizengella marina TaxID=2507566 RepID=A0A6N9Q830_9BACL|nr:GNAT family protein [Chengkuizengella marina]NBI30851.1 N-acetyltransferase [Chengkuizengella marina]